MASRSVIALFLSALASTGASCVGDSCNETPGDETSMLQVHQEVASRSLLSVRGRTGMNSSIDDELEAKPCETEIQDQWDHGTGAGYTCCKKLSKADIAKQGLCGICLLGKQGAAGKYEACSKVYCAAQAGVTDDLLGKIAKACSPTALQLKVTKPPTGMFSVVANNPQKDNLKAFMLAHKADFKKLSGKITGTQNSAKLCLATTEAKGAAFDTSSGPYGGDAELAGLLAMDKVDKTGFLDGLIFFKDVKEAHKEDINSLVNIVTAVLPKGYYGFDATEAKTVLQKLTR